MKFITVFGAVFRSDKKVLISDGSVEVEEISFPRQYPNYCFNTNCYLPYPTSVQLRLSVPGNDVARKTRHMVSRMRICVTQDNSYQSLLCEIVRIRQSRRHQVGSLCYWKINVLIRHFVITSFVSQVVVRVNSDYYIWTILTNWNDSEKVDILLLLLSWMNNPIITTNSFYYL